MLEGIKSVTTSLKVFGLYMMLVPGVGLMTQPEFLLDMFGLSHGGHFWSPRVVGLLAFIIGTYQFTIARQQLESLYRITVMQRYLAACVFTGLFLSGDAAISILLFAAIDFAGATWTLITAYQHNRPRIAG